MESLQEDSLYICNEPTKKSFLLLLFPAGDAKWRMPVIAWCGRQESLWNQWAAFGRKRMKDVALHYHNIGHQHHCNLEQLRWVRPLPRRDNQREPSDYFYCFGVSAWGVISQTDAIPYVTMWRYILGERWILKNAWTWDKVACTKIGRREWGVEYKTWQTEMKRDERTC